MTKQTDLEYEIQTLKEEIKELKKDIKELQEFKDENLSLNPDNKNSISNQPNSRPSESSLTDVKYYFIIVRTREPEPFKASPDPSKPIFDERLQDLPILSARYYDKIHLSDVGTIYGYSDDEKFKALDRYESEVLFNLRHKIVTTKRGEIFRSTVSNRDFRVFNTYSEASSARQVELESVF